MAAWGLSPTCWTSSGGSGNREGDLGFVGPARDNTPGTIAIHFKARLGTSLAETRPTAPWLA
jgi:hypothetical protein